MIDPKNRLSELKGWSLSADGKCIFIEYKMKNFTDAVGFIQKVAVLAEAMDHHPDIHLTGYRKLRLELSTHSIGALSDKDFALASKIDSLRDSPGTVPL